MTPRITTSINNTVIEQGDIDAWESRRARAVVRKLARHLGQRGFREATGDNPANLVALPADDLRAALTAAKLALGPVGTYAMLKRELAASERVARVGARQRRFAFAHTSIRVEDVSADGFARWFTSLVDEDRRVQMLSACPDHYLLRRTPSGHQEVVETTGGAPAASRFVVDYTATTGVAIPSDSTFPLQIAGEARLDDGPVIGGVRHQLRDRGGAMEASLSVQFPALTPRRLLRAHEWHLACEFGNWARAYAAEQP
ncbi:hypothetical protein [Tsukamurella paurometabola]|uniref:Uncharacterized protein n=1 Tax=Tsukamurella paurometabola (strain ATCC 8368 / DSM 20162 / CCUG 35730 / CIP 100753 / JCM 10117 / KCTC 9821 / NBRC 16120 / NCIMB 702349 / NCTC 13040) TaxID=521096 RepID=D5UQ61_TSUPD|nr:hypothetical protein [Tsukamurella paurometabola]ADG78831.1 conserved hypothetical protein [Tsukamurella paurometabola DSM 20162]SUP33270.1 Uncharacterised protein [Tsukamurella paurometabola]